MRKHGNKRTTDSEVEIKKIQMNQLQQIQSYTYTRNNDDGSHSEGALEVGRRGGEAQAWAGGGPRGGHPPPVDEVNEVKESDGDSDLDQVSEVKD